MPAARSEMKTAMTDTRQAELIESTGFAVGSSGGSSSHFLVAQKRSPRMPRRKSSTTLVSKSLTIGDAKSLYISLLKAIYDVFGMGKTTIFGYKSNSASFAVNAATILILRHTLMLDRKSTRLNSSHLGISYAVF